MVEIKVFTRSITGQGARLARLGRFTARYRWAVIGAWIVLTVFGGFAAGKLSSRWYQSTSIPGKPAYETGQQALKAFGAGVRPPDVVVFPSRPATSPRSPRYAPRWRASRRRTRAR